MGRIRIAHPELGVQFTRLASDAAASAVTSTVQNTTSFSVNDLVVYGNPGEEKSEIVRVTSVTAPSTLGHSAGLTFGHGEQTRISQIKYNQAEIYRATAQGGSYSLIATVSLTVDEEATLYDDLNGTSSSWYKIRYKNSITTTYSDYSVEIQATGYTDDSLGSMTNEVLEELNDPDADVRKRNRIRSYLRSGVTKLMIRTIKVLPDYHRQRTTQDLTADTATYNKPTRFLAFFKIVINFTGTTESLGYKANFETEDQGDPDTIYSTTDPRIFFRANQWGIKPTPTSSSGRAFLYYWDYPAVMTDDDDEHGLEYGARDVLITYALYRAWRKTDKEVAESYKDDWIELGNDYIEFVAQQRQFAHNKSVEIIFGGDMYED